MNPSSWLPFPGTVAYAAVCLDVMSRSLCDISLKLLSIHSRVSSQASQGWVQTTTWQLNQGQLYRGRASLHGRALEHMQRVAKHSAMYAMCRLIDCIHATFASEDVRSQQVYNRKQ